MTSSSEERLEIKFIGSPENLELVRSWIKLNALGFSIHHPIRRVNNIYFDSHNFDTYLQNLDGTSQRTKLRYRWYGFHDFPQTGQLEVKQKRNLYGTKLSFGCDGIFFDFRPSHTQVVQTLGEELPEAAKLWLKSFPKAILLNRYSREYYRSKDKKIRITIDQKQAVFDQRYGRLLNISRESNLPDYFILELKFSKENKGVAVRCAKDIPLRISRHSKYVVGLNSILSF